MQRLSLAILATLAIMYLVAFPIYGALSLVTDIQPPSPGSPGLFMPSVLVVQVAVAIVPLEHCHVISLTPTRLPLSSGM